ncbi:F0F1 ATP synthase subunit A [Candidatus Curtissbacteria bacterium]|nr:F0F1 ATP synthase subunit A [Candidatus Curtissbacteria bacterium]
MAEAHVALAAEKLFSIGPFPVTNSVLTTWIVTIILIAFAFLATKNAALAPKGLQNIAEIAFEALEGLVSSIAGDKTKVFLPIIVAFFFFILFGNYFGLLPGVGSIGFYEKSKLSAEVESKVSNGPNESKAESPDERSTINEIRTFVPYLRSMNSDLNTTMALAIVSTVATHFLAIRYLGLFGYIGKFISLNPIFLFVGLLELVGEVTKIFSLSFRLFGNIFAGEVLLTTAITKVFAVLAPVPFYFLEILVGFVQALIFSMLTLVFMVILTQKSEHGAH